MTPTASAIEQPVSTVLDDALRSRLNDLVGKGELKNAHCAVKENYAGADDSALWQLLGHLCVESGDTTSGIQCFQEALKAEPRNDDALEAIVQVYLNSEQFDNAAILASKWTETRPESCKAWLALARLHLMAEQTAQARKALGRALALQPTNKAINEAYAALGEDCPGNADSVEEDEAALPFLAPLDQGPVTPVTFDPPILWVGAALNLSSYGIHTRQSIVWLRQAGLQVEAQSVGATSNDYLRTVDIEELREVKNALSHSVRDGIFVMHHAPATADDPDCYRHYKWRRPNQLAYVALTAFETEGLPPHWIAPLNRMDEVWLQSEFNMRTFADAGVRADKLRLVGAGVDTHIYDPQKVTPMERPADRAFMFLSVFQWHSRKGWQILIESFARTFSRKQDVCLVIKTTPVRGNAAPIENQINQHLAGLGLSREECAPIIVIDQDMNDAEMRALYRAADAFVLPTRGEGWGIPFHEAMAMGMPVIGTRWGGHLTYMNDANSYLVDVQYLVNADDMMLRFNMEYAGLSYADPDGDHLSYLMRRVIERPEEAREKGKQARADICRNWSKEAYVQRIRTLARDLAARAGKRSHVRASQSRKDLLPVIVHGPALDPSGYAHDFRNLILGLKKSEVDVRLDHQTWNTRYGLVNPAECAEIADIIDNSLPEGPHISIENSLVPPPDPDRNAYRIVRSFWETDRYPLQIAEKLRGADEVWVACAHNADALARSGVSRDKVQVVPVALNAEMYGPHAFPLEYADPTFFTFLSCFDISLRKGWDVLLKAFLEEFAPDDDVALLLNLHSSQGANREYLAAHVERWALRFAGDKWIDAQGKWRTGASPIRCVPRELKYSEMPSFYQSGDAYVMASRGEGWAIPAMEAMASGLPVVATSWGGHMDYMNDENSFLVKYRLVPVSAQACRECSNFAGQMWAEPDVEDMRRQLRLVREDSAEAMRRGISGRQAILTKYNRDAVNSQVVDRLRKISKSILENGKQSLKKPRKTSVIWEGCQLYRSSLALVNRELVKHIDQSGNHAIHLLASEPRHDPAVCNPRLSRRLQKLMDGSRDAACDVFVRHGWPPDFTRPPKAKRFVMIQPWEFGMAPESWVPQINSQVDELWVPSRHVFESYVASGVNPEKVWVVPNGVDLDVFKPEGPKMELPTSKHFRFLFVGGTIWRKGIDVLLKAYCASFRREDDVVLVIKDMGGNSFYKGQCAEQAIRQLQQRKDLPEIVYMTDDMTDEQMASLYRSCDCLVLPYRGEGFGLPVAEAGACGIPVIVSQGGATDDFVPVDGGFFIQCRRIPFKMTGEHATNGWVLEPDMHSLAEQMKKVNGDSDDRARRKSILCSYMRRKQSWAQAAGAVEARLRILAGE